MERPYPSSDEGETRFFEEEEAARESREEAEEEPVD